MAKPQLHLPKGQNYSCIQCGRSCGMFNEIIVDEESERTIDKLDYRPLIQEGYEDLSPFIEGEYDPEKTRLRKTEEGFCVFCDHQRLCAIHKQYGYDAKPKVCRQFPYRFVDTPGGTFVGLSFACTAVLQNEGKPLVENEPEIAGYYDQSFTVRDATKKPQLTHQWDFSWEGYRLLEEDLHALLDMDGTPKRRLPSG